MPRRVMIWDLRVSIKWVFGPHIWIIQLLVHDTSWHHPTIEMRNSRFLTILAKSQSQPWRFPSSVRWSYRHMTIILPTCKNPNKISINNYQTRKSHTILQYTVFLDSYNHSWYDLNHPINFHNEGDQPDANKSGSCISSRRASQNEAVDVGVIAIGIQKFY